MDFLRSCYKAKMRTIIGADPVDVIWFRVSDDTPMYSTPNIFTSRVWCVDPFNDQMGEQSAGRVCCGSQDIDWWNGRPPPALVPGPHPCGTDAVAQTGAGPDDPKFMTGDDGSAPCCAPEPGWSASIFGTIGVRGEWSTSGAYPPVGVTIFWFDNLGNSGSAVAGSGFTTFPYPHLGFTSFDLQYFFSPPVPPHIQFFASTTSEVVQFWGANTLRTALTTVPPGFLRIFTFNW